MYAPPAQQRLDEEMVSEYLGEDNNQERSSALDHTESHGLSGY
jgi:hypothetical protein